MRYLGKSLVAPPVWVLPSLPVVSGFPREIMLSPVSPSIPPVRVPSVSVPARQGDK